MKTIQLTVTFLVGVMLIFSAATLTASDPVGVYAIVQKVVFEPNDEQLWLRVRQSVSNFLETGY